MVSHSFSPRTEQFESKLLLAADLMPVPQTEHIEAMTAEVDTVSNSGVHDSTMMLHTERVDYGMMLVVQFMEAHTTRVLHIPGGDSATTQGDGSARLRLPEDLRLVDLSIRELMSDEVSVIRLEIADDGQILNQLSLNGESSSDPDSHLDVVISPIHSSNHAPTANASLFSNTDDWTHGPQSMWDHDDSFAASNVDSAMAHEPGTSTPSANMSHGSSTAGYSSRPHTASPENSSNAVEGADAMATGHTATEGTTVGISAASQAQETIELPVDEDLESILANWTSGQPNGTTPILSGSPIRPAFTEVLAVPAEQPAGEPPAVVLVSYVSGDETVSASEVSAVSHWPFAGGVLVAAAAVGGAAALNRRAEQLRAEATGIIHLSMD